MSKKVTNFVVFLLLVSFYLSSHAAKEENKKNVNRFPRGCSQTGYQYHHYNLILNTSKRDTPRGIFFVHNISDKTIELRQSQTGNEPYIIQSRTSIRPNRWAVFSAAEKNVKFICTNKSPKSLHDKVVQCKPSLDICEYARVKFGDNNGGNYWVTTNNSRRGSVRTVIYHGILLRGL